MNEPAVSVTNGPGRKRRIMEDQMPLTAISVQSAREKSIRHGHLSTLHIWWARRPLVACRAAVFAALVPQPDDPAAAAKMQTFIAKLANWDNSIDSESAAGPAGVHHTIRDARAYIRAGFPDRAPRVLDPFAGGGAIPLEALRLGCETYALDLNPVAHIIELATLVYPQKYAGRPGPYGDKPGATLVGDVRKWGQRVLDKVRTEIGDLYPHGPDNTTTVAILWARTVACPNAACGVPVPLIRQTWLARKAKKHIAYKVEADGPGSIPRFRIVQGMTATDFDFDPAVGTSLGGIATCPSCGTPLSEKHIKSEALAERLGALPVAIVIDAAGGSGKRYREVTTQDHLAFTRAGERLQALKERYDPFSGELPPIPDEKIAQRRITGGSCVVYGLDDFGKLFNSRQALALATFARYVRCVYSEIVEETGDPEYAKAVTTFLALAVDRLANQCSVLCRWNNVGEKIEGVFSRQALPMVWDYAEVNPFSGATGDWNGAIEWIWKVIEHESSIDNNVAEVSRGTSTKLSYPDGYFDAVITDPPYLDNISYATVSDFFYAWLKRTVSHLYPSVLGAPVTPKEQEIIKGGAMVRSEEWFEAELEKGFQQCARVLADDGVCVVIYAHKAISAWESLVGSLLRAGLTVEASWPFNTEMSSRLVGQGTAALASSIFLVCRKRRASAGVGMAGDVRRSIEANVRARLDQFWAAGLRGADFFISAIGPATAAFSQYDKVMTLGGADVTVTTLLEWVQQTVADYALRRVFSIAAHEQGSDAPEAGLGDVDDETRFYVLWRWTYDGQASLIGVTNGVEEAGQATENDFPANDAGQDEEVGTATGQGGSKKIPFGDAHLMATALGSDINALIHRSHVLDGKSTVTLLGASDRAELIADFGERRADESRPPLIDILHRSELLWAAGRPDDLAEYLDDVLPGDRDALRRVAQALVDLLPRGDSEKQRLEGFLFSDVARDIPQGERTAGGGRVVQLGFGGDIGPVDTPTRGKRRGKR